MAFADESIDTNPSVDELQRRIEESAAALDEARARAEEAAAGVAAVQAEISDLERQIPVQQKRSDKAARELYKLESQSSGLLDLLLASSDFENFMNNLEYVNHATRANIAEINRLNKMKDQLTESRDALAKAQEQAEADAVEANRALTEAQEARLEAQRRAEEEARQRAEQEAAAAAAAARAAERKAEEASGAAASSNEASNIAVELISDGADWSADEETFVAEWTARIDAYLAGSALAGYGRNFAQAAWDYGVDPRWSPAISFTESSKGAVCFLPHNAWGWGSVSWDSWEEAIDAHVRGLARGYGYTISLDAARKYCPPNAVAWYERTLGQMNLI